MNTPNTKKRQTKRMRLLILAILSAVLLTLLMASCSKASLSEAKLVGYDGASFEKTMDSFASTEKEEAALYGEDISFLCEWKEGWSGSGAPSTSLLVSKESPVTYIMTVTIAANGETETNRLAFYLVHNEKNNTLSVQGGVMIEDGEEYPIDLDEAKEMLEEVFDTYN